MVEERDEKVKAQLPDGIWQSEPDYKHWVDESTGLDCLIVRNEVLGHLCGYVGVPKSHILFGEGYDEVHNRFDVSVHGGLTYANECRGKVCHKSDDGDHVWWLGFDCAHCDDLSPGMQNMYFPAGILPRGEYRDIEYVREQCEALALQIKQYEIDNL